MQFNNKSTRSVADVVTRILSGQPVSEELKGDQHKIDANKNNKIDAEDFKILRGEKKTVKEESCEDEAKEEVKKHEKKHHGKDGDVAKHEKEMHKEESEQLDEYDSKEGRYVHKGSYGYGGKGAEHGQTDYKKENEAEKEMNKKKPARKGYGARQNFVRSYAKESFSGLLDVYREGGLKSLHEALIVEEPTNDEFQAELADHKAKAELKKKQPDIAKPSVQAVKVEEDVELSVDDINGVKVSTIEERSLTEPEMKKKEEIVKGMKKNLAGFKARYGDDAKSVMYATATKAAKKD
jgi:hypothetical protein